MSEANYGKIFGLLLGAVFAFVLALNALAESGF
jgi:hypothetical protein